MKSKKTIKLLTYDFIGPGATVTVQCIYEPTEEKADYSISGEVVNVVFIDKNDDSTENRKNLTERAMAEFTRNINDYA